MAGLYDRKLFRMQAGGMMPPVEMPTEVDPIDNMSLISPEQEAMIYQEAQNLPPEVLQAADQEVAAATDALSQSVATNAIQGEVDRSVANIDMAGDFRDLMNVVWDDDADIEVYRNKLAQVVGQEDANRTPDSVLALVQPTLQLAEIDQGIGALMQEELADVGDAGGGIMGIQPQSPAVDGMEAAIGGMASETNALVNAVGAMSPTDRPSVSEDMRMMAAMLGSRPMGQGMV